MTEPTHPRRRSCRVVKVGGSLLTLPRLEHVLTAWWDRQDRLPTLLVVGGGELANAVRDLDRRCALDAATAHWMAIRAMQVNGFVLCQTLRDAEWVTNSCHWLDRRTRSDQHRLGVVAIEEFLKAQEPHQPGMPLPIGWQVTSDSIAARLAEVVRAEELVLLKSTLPQAQPAQLPMMQAVLEQLVDDHFPLRAVHLPCIRLVNLRAAECGEMRLVP